MPLYPAVDNAAAVGSLRSLGTGALQAAAGNDTRITGAVAKNRLVYNVKDFGAIADGNSHTLTAAGYGSTAAANAAFGNYGFITDLDQEVDWAAIMYAINASVRGSTILFTDGQYVVADPIIYSGSRLYTGTGGSMSWRNAGTYPTIQVRSTGTSRWANKTSGWTGVFIATGLANNSGSADEPVEFADFGIHANNVFPGVLWGIVSNNYWSTFDNLYLAALQGGGLLFTNRATNNTTHTYGVNENTITRCRLSGCGGGIHAPDSNMPDYMIAYNNIGPCPNNHAIYSANMSGWNITNNHIWTVNQSAIHSDYTWGATVADNYIEEFGLSGASASTYYGILVQPSTIGGGPPTMVHGNRIGSSESGTNATHKYISAVSRADGTHVAVSIVNNRLYQWYPPRTVSIGTTSGSPNITFAADAVVPGDIGSSITGTGITGGTTIATRPISTTGTLSANATVTGTNTLTIKKIRGTGIEVSTVSPGTGVPIDAVIDLNDTAQVNTAYSLHADVTVLAHQNFTATDLVTNSTGANWRLRGRYPATDAVPGTGLATWLKGDLFVDDNGILWYSLIDGDRTQIGGPYWWDNQFALADNGDRTKRVQFDISPVTTATTRTLTVPNASGSIVLEYPEVRADRIASFKSWSQDVDLASATISPVAATVYLTKLPWPTTQTITNVYVGLQTAGATLTNGYVAVYNSAGTKQVQSADQSGATGATWGAGGTVGLKTVSVSSTSVTSSGVTDFIWVVVYVGTATTMPKFYGMPAAAISTMTNAGNTAATARHASQAVANTATLPALTPASNTLSTLALWAAVA